jgi:hypothetical protein
MREVLESHWRMTAYEEEREEWKIGGRAEWGDAPTKTGKN